MTPREAQERRAAYNASWAARREAAHRQIAQARAVLDAARVRFIEPVPDARANYEWLTNYVKETP